jgi:hypothetical protein
MAKARFPGGPGDPDLNWSREHEEVQFRRACVTDSPGFP